MRKIGLAVLLLLIWSVAGTGHGMAADISDYLPTSGETPG